MPIVSLQLTNTVAHFRVPRTKITKAVSVVFQKLKKRVGISLVFVSDREIIRLHAKFLHLRSSTDVLTFVSEDSERRLEVEIFICVETARRQAIQHRVSLRNELIRLSVHGALHAAGFDDHGAADRVRMWKRQENIVKIVDA